MFAVQARSIRTRYNATVALLLLAFVMSPVVLFASRPLESYPVMAAFVFSALCTVVAWSQWRWNAEERVPSILQPTPRVK